MERQRWVVDSLGKDVARIEVNGADVLTVPRWLLPDDAEAGEVLAASIRRDAEEVTVTVHRDPASTREARAASAKQMRDAPVDKGGDITL